MNNDIIDHPSYYRMPDGNDLEDFIYGLQLNFDEGCAVKYLFRAGFKDGESRTKDECKASHYAMRIAKRHRVDVLEVMETLNYIVEGAKTAGRAAFTDDFVKMFPRPTDFDYFFSKLHGNRPK